MLVGQVAEPFAEPVDSPILRGAADYFLFCSLPIQCYTVPNKITLYSCATPAPLATLIKSPVAAVTVIPAAEGIDKQKKLPGVRGGRASLAAARNGTPLAAGRETVRGPTCAVPSSLVTGKWMRMALSLVKVSAPKMFPKVPPAKSRSSLALAFSVRLSPNALLAWFNPVPLVNDEPNDLERVSLPEERSESLSSRAEIARDSEPVNVMAMVGEVSYLSRSIINRGFRNRIE